MSCEITLDEIKFIAQKLENQELLNELVIPHCLKNQMTIKKYVTR